MKRAGIVGLVLCWCGLMGVPAMGDKAASQPTSMPGAIIRGTISAAYHRPIRAEKDPELAELLKRFETPAEDFWYKKRLVRETEAYQVWLVTFPSPYASPDKANNVVWGEYYRSKAKGPKPGVVVLHPLDQRVGLIQRESGVLAEAGMDCIWIRMAYFGQRAPEGFAKQLSILQSMDRLVSSVCQSVMDFRRATEFLSAQPGVERDKIYLCGGSLGALVGSVVMGVDGNYPKAAFMLGGCDLPRIFTANETVIRALTFTNKSLDLSQEGLRRSMKAIEPLTYIQRAQNTEVLLLNMRDDGVIPPETSRTLAKHLAKVECHWYDGGHMHIPVSEMNEEILNFLKK